MQREADDTGQNLSRQERFNTELFNVPRDFFF